MTGPFAAEARRQAAFVTLLAETEGETPSLRFAETADRAAAGLRAYRRHAVAAATKSLAAVFPTVHRLLGSDAFARLAGEHRTSCASVHGDLGEWGGALPDFIAGQPALQPWPWLADVARLDRALHRNERAADASTDRLSLRLLTEVDPARLRLVLMPGTAVLRSDWPVAALHHAHRVAEDASGAAFSAARGAVDAGRGESVMIVRQGWRAAVVLLDPPTVAWTEAVLAHEVLATALDRAGPGFDFAAWLVRAVGDSWLQCVEAVPLAPSTVLEGDDE